MENAGGSPSNKTFYNLMSIMILSQVWVMLLQCDLERHNSVQ